MTAELIDIWRHILLVLRDGNYL